MGKFDKSNKSSNLPNGSALVKEAYKYTAPNETMRQMLNSMRSREIPAIMQKMIDAAKAGDFLCMKFFLEREIPRDPAIHYDIPFIQTPAQALRFIQNLTVDLGKGLITPTEAQVIQSHVQTILSAIEMVEVDERLKLLENAGSTQLPPPSTN